MRLINWVSLGWAGTALLLGTISITQMSRITALERRLETFDKQTAWFQKETRNQIAMLATANAQPAIAEQVRASEKLESQLASVQAQANQDRDELVRKLTATQAHERQLRAEFNRLSAATRKADTEIAEVGKEVGAVKSTLATHSNRLDSSASEMKRVMGDLGVQGGLLATNRKELTALRAVGDRNFYDFDLTRGKGPYRIADVSVAVKRTDPKRSRFTIEVISNDKRMERADRTLNEPVQFYMPKLVGPYAKSENVLYEIVVNEVKKDRIIGYLTTPRIETFRN